MPPDDNEWGCVRPTGWREGERWLPPYPEGEINPTGWLGSHDISLLVFGNVRGAL